MKRLLYLFLVVLFAFFTLAKLQAADLANDLTNALSKKISEFASGLIPGEGITEVNIELKDHEEPDFTILGVRDISKTNNSNFFTQFSLHNDDVGGDERYIANLGLGKRFLNSDKSIMYGLNSFIDRDLRRGHTRGSVGFEARAAILEFNYNQYLNLTDRINVEGVNEQPLAGSEYNLNSQIPYMPWAVISWRGYKHYGDMATQSTKGDIYSMELALNPSLQLDLKRDISNHGDGNTYGALLSFVYPPRKNKPSLVDGLESNDMFVKSNMEDKLSSKVKRNNNLVVEVQGAVIITSK